LIQSLSQLNTVVVGLVASLAAGLGTGVGALPIFFAPDISRRILDAMLGFAAGVMLAATSFSLLIPAIEYAGGGLRGAVTAGLGLLLGGIFLSVIDRLSPHVHFVSGHEGLPASLSRIWLFVIAIAIHNFPEGLAVGVGFSHGDIGNGLVLTLGVALQNMPEGLAVAVPLVREGYSKKKAFLIALATGLVEPIGALVGATLVQLAAPLLPLGLAFAGGAMLFVISDEIIPEMRLGGFQRMATHALLAGFVLMMILDTAIG
jgi:ZIP family zinc transporter